MEETTTAAVSLPNDVLLEILFCIRNDRATLFRCAMACKRWRRLVADPGFLRRCWPSEKELYTLAGFFAQKRHHQERGAEVAPFIPAPRSAVGPGRRALAYFFPSAPAGLLDDAEPLASRHGLLLVRLDASTNATVAWLAVCNPLAGTCDLLPPLNWDSSYKGYAILTSADCPSWPMSYFRVLVFHTRHGVDMVSSAENTRWSRTPVHHCLGNFAIHIYESNAAVCHGKAHWLGYNRILSCLCTINVNTETGEVSTTKLVAMGYSSQYSQSLPCLSLNCGGTLSVIWLRRPHLTVETWKKQDKKEGIDEDGDDTSTWHCTRVIELKKAQETKIQGRASRILGEKCGMLLVSEGEQVYVTHLETGIMEEVTEWPWGHITHGEARPFEMDWRTFFVSRLGSQ